MEEKVLTRIEMLEFDREMKRTAKELSKEKKDFVNYIKNSNIKEYYYNNNVNDKPKGFKAFINKFINLFDVD